MIPVFEQGDTRQFTWQSCVAPDSAPVFSVTEPFSFTGVNTQTAGSSSSTAYYAFFTMPASIGIYSFQWRAEKTIGSSLYPFIDRGKFKVERTRPIP